MTDRNCDFPKALEFVANTIGYSHKNVRIIKPFHGFYEKMIKSMESPELEVATYNESELPDATSFSYKFLKEGVDIITQKRFGVRYDHETDGIIIPEHSIDGKLVGAKWRNNNPNCAMNERWGMYLRFQKSYVLYGWNQNYKYIVENGRLYIVEAEKSVMQMSSFGCNLGLAIGGHDISKIQAKYIKSLGIREIIVAFDEGISEEQSRYEAEKLIISNQFFANKVGYVYDKDHKWLKDGSKDSLSDNGKDVFDNITNNCITWIN